MSELPDIQWMQPDTGDFFICCFNRVRDGHSPDCARAVFPPIIAPGLILIKTEKLRFPRP